MQGAIASIADSISRIPGCSFFISFFLVNDSDKNLPLSGFKYLAEESKCLMMGNDLSHHKLSIVLAFTSIGDRVQFDLKLFCKCCKHIKDLVRGCGTF